MPNPYGKPQRAVIVDLDTTLVDTGLDIVAALNALLAEHGRPALGVEAVRGMVGDGAEKLVERDFTTPGGFAPHALAKLSRRFLELYEQRVGQLSRPFRACA